MNFGSIPKRDVSLYQQGTYRSGWKLSLAGQSGHGRPGQHRHGIFLRRHENDFPGLKRFAGRLAAGDPPGILTSHEAVLAEGQAPQTNGLRWEDYATSAMDPSDDHTIWYVGDYLKKGGTNYSSRIGAFRLTPLQPVANYHRYDK